MHQQLERLREVANAIHPFREEEWNAFERIWSPFSAARKAQLTAPGDVERYLYFVCEGVQRVYYFDDENREATLVFSYPPSFSGVLDSFMTRSPSRYYFETLTPSEFLRASFTDLENLAQHYPAIETMLRKGLSHSLAGVLERLAEVQCFSSEEKFRTLLQRSPHILQLVPHKYLASYLGIDVTNFSKLMNRVKL